MLYGVEYAGAIWMGSTKLSGDAALCEELEGCMDWASTTVALDKRAVITRISVAWRVSQLLYKARELVLGRR